MVYGNEATGVRSFVAWNPTARPQEVEFFEGGKSLGRLEVPPHRLASATQLAR